MADWLSGWCRSVFESAAPTCAAATARRCRPALESLEDRCLPAPVTTATLAGTAGQPTYYRSAVALTLQAQDDSGGDAFAITYTVNGGQQQQYSAPVTFRAHGTYTVEYFATDDDGNQEPPRELTFTIDPNSPSAVPTEDALADRIEGVIRKQAELNVAAGALFTPDAVALLPAGGFTRMAGGTYGYQVALDTDNVSTPTEPGRSTLRLFERWADGRVVELTRANAAHADIGRLGLGRFSAWRAAPDAATVLYFSASDATSPLTNGRKYFYVADDDSFDPNAPLTSLAVLPLRINNTTTRRTEGYAYRIYAGLPGGADNPVNAWGSQVRLFEVRLADGAVVELTGAHAQHTEIAARGTGMFSHWAAPNGVQLYLSSSDNTDPTRNGRLYVVVVPVDPFADHAGTVTGAGNTGQAALLTSTDPEHRVIRIANPTGHAFSGLTIRINGQLFSRSTQELLKEASRLPAAFAGEPLYRKIFRYVATELRFGRPLTGTNWQHEPLLLLNSLGYGICDDFASTFTHLARAAGYRARVVALTNHVVAELFNARTGDWEMYDPCFGVYFTMANGQVAHARKLWSMPSLMMNPLTRLDTNPDLMSPYSTKYAKYYTSYRVAKSYDTIPTRQQLPRFAIPPGGQIEIGYQGIEPPIVYRGARRATVDPTLAITIPAGQTFVLSPYLALAGFRGRGRVFIEGVEYAVGSARLAELIARQEQFYAKIKVVAWETVTAHYWVSAARFDLGTPDAVNVVSVLLADARGAGSVQVSLAPV